MSALARSGKGRITIDTRLRKHIEDLEIFFKNASDFLVRCQIIDPYVERGTLKGAVCPWEIGVADNQGLLILEDFHDTLEAMWVWCYYNGVSKNDAYEPNIEMGWNYVTSNFERFIPPDKEGEGLYDCSHIVLCGSLYEKTFRDDHYHKWIETAGNRLAQYLLKASQKGYTDFGMKSCFAWWDASCLASAAQSIGKIEWLEAARTFVRRSVSEQRTPFCDIEREPRHRGPGDPAHECFSCNANKALALLSCHPSEKGVSEMILHKFLPVIPKNFVKRRVDENPWNANVAMALGKSYLLTGEEQFLHSYFTIMDELKRRDVQNSSALSRSVEFPARESWVTFFYAYAYASAVVM